MKMHHKLLIEAGERIGVQVTDMTEQWHHRILRCEFNGQTKYVRYGQQPQEESAVMQSILYNKIATRELLAENGLPVSPGVYVKTIDDLNEKVAAFIETHAPVVIKPMRGEFGAGVQVGVKSIEQVRMYIEEQQRERWLIIEQHAPGEDVRIQAVDGKLVAMCTRVPANVIGDGHSTIEELIAAKNKVKYAQNPHNCIDVDDVLLSMLQEQQVNINSVPKEGTQIVLKRVSNLSQGGDAVDITEEAHERYAELVEHVARVTHTGFFSIDMMSIDSTKDPYEHGRILEINEAPMWAHHTFSEVRQHDIGGMMLKAMFGIA